MYFLGIGKNNALKIQQCAVQLSTKPPGHDLPSNCSLALLLLGINFQDIHVGLAQNIIAFSQTLARKGSVLIQWLSGCRSPPGHITHPSYSTRKFKLLREACTLSWYIGKLKNNASHHWNGLTWHGTCENSGKLKT